jgi:hypothetical protein
MPDKLQPACHPDKLQPACHVAAAGRFGQARQDDAQPRGIAHQPEHAGKLDDPVVADAQRFRADRRHGRKPTGRNAAA